TIAPPRPEVPKDLRSSPFVTHSGERHQRLPREPVLSKAEEPEGPALEVRRSLRDSELARELDRGGLVLGFGRRHALAYDVVQDRLPASIARAREKDRRRYANGRIGVVDEGDGFG